MENHYWFTRESKISIQEMILITMTIKMVAMVVMIITTYWVFIMSCVLLNTNCFILKQVWYRHSHDPHLTDEKQRSTEKLNNLTKIAGLVMDIARTGIKEISLQILEILTDLFWIIKWLIHLWD